MDLILPLDYAAIERILPHRYPFLLVDRITEFEVDKRIVGIKNVSLNERYLSHERRSAGAAANDSDRSRGAGRRHHDSREARKPPSPHPVSGHRARPLPPARAPRRRRGNRSARRAAEEPDGPLQGRGRVNGKVIASGTMTFALGPVGQRVPAIDRATFGT